MIRQGHCAKSIVPFRVLNILHFLLYANWVHLILFVGTEGSNAKSQEKVVALMNNYQIWKPLKVLPFSISLAFIFFPLNCIWRLHWTWPIHHSKIMTNCLKNGGEKTSSFFYGPYNKGKFVSLRFFLNVPFFRF